jgi:hypothetical protein
MAELNPKSLFHTCQTIYKSIKLCGEHIAINPVEEPDGSAGAAVPQEMKP